MASMARRNLVDVPVEAVDPSNRYPGGWPKGGLVLAGRLKIHLRSCS
jgi:hypothetical protein